MIVRKVLESFKYAYIHKCLYQWSFLFWSIINNYVQYLFTYFLNIFRFSYIILVLIWFRIPSFSVSHSLFIIAWCQRKPSQCLLGGCHRNSGFNSKVTKMQLFCNWHFDHILTPHIWPYGRRVAMAATVNCEKLNMQRHAQMCVRSWRNLVSISNVFPLPALGIGHFLSICRKMLNWKWIWFSAKCCLLRSVAESFFFLLNAALFCFLLIRIVLCFIWMWWQFEQIEGLRFHWIWMGCAQFLGSVGWHLHIFQSRQKSSVILWHSCAALFT